ncbi:MAG: PTS sugar transporter subunit IIA [Acetivibrio ethanolgignens]
MELLEKKNIRINCQPKSKNEVIQSVGQMLFESGYVKKDYIAAMVEREKTFSTNIGNGIALPHGTDNAKREIISSGIAVQVFPEGTEWGEEKVQVVIGIAGVGDAHLDILAHIAEKLSDPSEVGCLVKSDEEGVYRMLTGKE